MYELSSSYLILAPFLPNISVYWRNFLTDAEQAGLASSGWGAKIHDFFLQ